MSDWLIGLMLFCANILLLKVYLSLSHKFHWFDNPNEDRKLHNVSKPTSAGMVFMLFIPVFLLINTVFGETYSYIIAASLIVLTIVGAVDDFVHISVKFRFLIITVFSAILSLYLYPPDVFPIVLGLIFLLGVIWWVNLFNFMDGADGLAVLHSIITAFGYLLVLYLMHDSDHGLFQLVMAFLICLIAFLLFNFPKAKMFMGDSGSLSVSSLFAVIALYGIYKDYFDEILVVSFHLTFIVDATLTLFTRLKFGHKISEAHNLHLFQSLINTKAYSHSKVSILYAGVTLLNVVIASMAHYFAPNEMIKALILLFQAGVLCVFWIKFYLETKFERFRM